MYNTIKSATKIALLLLCCVIHNISIAEVPFIPTRIDFSLNNSFATGGLTSYILGQGQQNLRLRIARITWKDANGQTCFPDDVEPHETLTNLPMIFPSTKPYIFLKNIPQGCFLDKVYFISQFWDITEPATNTFTISNYDPALPPWETQIPNETVTVNTHFETLFSYTTGKSMGFGAPACSSAGCSLKYEMFLNPHPTLGLYEYPCYNLVIKGYYSPFNTTSPNIGDLTTTLNPEDISFNAYGSTPCPIYDKYAEIF